MRKKQIFALLMAGALTVGMNPSAAFATEEADAFIEGEAEAFSEEDDAAETAENGEEFAEETPEVPTEAPASESEEETPVAPEQPVEAPAEEVSTEAPAEIPTEAPTEPTQEPQAEPTKEPEQKKDKKPKKDKKAEDEETAKVEEGQETTAVSVKGADGSETFYNSLAEAVEACEGVSLETAAQILIYDSIEIDSTINVGAKHVIIAAAKDNVTITRAAGFAENIFRTEGGSLQITVGTDETSGQAFEDFTIDGAGEGTTGSIVSVSTGTFLLGKGVTLTGNVTSAQGSAIHNEGGLIAITGGSITGNSTSAADGGAVYSKMSVYVMGDYAVPGDPSTYVPGTIRVAGNTGAEDSERNIVLEGATLMVGGSLAESDIHVLVNNAAADTQVVSPAEGMDAAVFAEALAQITYDDSAFKLDETGKLTAGALEPSVTPEPTEAPKPSVTPKPTEAPKPSVTPKPTEAPKPSVTPEPTKKPTRLKLTGKSMKWTGTASAEVTFRANEAGFYYVEYVKGGEKKPAYSADKAITAMQADTNYTFYLSDLPEGDIDVYVFAKDANGKVSSNNLLFKLNSKDRPVPPTEKPSRDPIKPAVTESKVQGLEKPLEFYPNTFYPFTVTGAGTKNTNPIEGDEKWVPLYWSTTYAADASQLDNSKKHSTWQIGAKYGIAQEATYKMYVYFQKWVYNGSEWVATDVISSAAYNFSSKKINMSTSITPTPGADGQGGGYYGEDGGYYGEDGTYYGEDPTYRDDDESGVGATTTAGNASTADNSPIGTMMMLASASVLAGGYVLVRKRKKTEE